MACKTQRRRAKALASRKKRPTDKPSPELREKISRPVVLETDITPESSEHMLNLLMNVLKEIPFRQN